AVASFLETIPSDFAGTFNQSGRGYPDVSTEMGLREQGTSASTPTFTSMIALINDRLVAAGPCLDSSTFHLFNSFGVQ
ncbi:hypothetical protein K438DRAFT_1579472, partial [Mycena galopus ATCC 62051]